MNPTPHRPIGEPTLGCSGKGRSTDPSAFKRRQTYLEKPLPDQFPSRGIANASRLESSLKFRERAALQRLK